MLRRLASGWDRWSRWSWIVGSVAAAIAISRLLRADTDFGGYLLAAREMHEGGVDLFRSRPGLGAFSYPHWVLLPLLPLLALPEPLVRVLYGLSLGWATVWIVGDVRRLVGARIALRPWHWVLFGVLFVRWLSSNYTNGQLSLWVAAWTLRGLRLLDAGGLDGGSWRRAARAGVSFGVAAAAKLTPLAFLLALPWMGARRAAAVMAATVAVLVFALPIPFLGVAEHTHHLQDLHRAMIAPLFANGEGGDAAVWTGPNASVRGTLGWVLRDTRSDPATEPRTHWVDLGPAAIATVQAVWSGVLLLVCALGFWRARRDPARLSVQGSIVCIATALFAPLTRSYHCAILLLAGMLFVTDRPRRRARRVLWFAVAVGFAFSMTLRQRALIGRELWFVLDRIGLLHLSIVGMLVLLATRPARADRVLTRR